MNRTLLMTLGLALLVAAVYWPVHGYGFIDLDDADYVWDNPYVHAAFGRSAFHYAFTSFAVGNWNPLLWLSFYTDRWLFNLEPRAMHVENVLLHLIAGCLVWRLVFVCTGKFLRGFAVAMLFLCHPMHVESVAWIAERKDVLSTPLLIGAMLAYVRFCKSQTTTRKRVAYVALLCLFVLSLLVKSMGVTLPAVLLLMDFWPLRRWPTRTCFYLLIEKIPLLLLSTAAAVLAGIAQRDSGALSSLIELDLSTRIENALISYVLYIAKLLVPTNLAVFYPHPMSRPFSASIAAGGLLLLVTALFCRLRDRKPYLIFGWLWFLGTLVPVIGLVQLGAQAMADRYSYFPSIGLLIAVVWCTCDLISNRAMLWSVLTVAVAGYSMAAHRQVTYWKDTQTLFSHALAVTPDNFLPHDELGGVYLSKHDVYHAIQEYQFAIADRPDPQAFHGLGNCYLGIDYSKSVFYYQQAVNLLPRSFNYRTDLASALRLDGRLPEAETQAQIAVQINNDDAPARAELANIFSQLRRTP